MMENHSENYDEFLNDMQSTWNQLMVAYNNKPQKYDFSILLDEIIEFNHHDKN